MNQYDPNIVIAEANQKWLNGDWEGGQFIYQSYLLEWTDDAREGGGGGSGSDGNNESGGGSDTKIATSTVATTTITTSSSSVQLEEAICTLYIAYAQYLITAKQYKTATLVYEDAINSSATILKNSIGRIYQEYTRFLLERDKRKSAQEVFVKALIIGTGSNGNYYIHNGAVQDEQDRDILWNDFLEMMQINNPTLTMKTLRQAMEEQYSSGTTGSTSMNAKSNASNDHHRPPPSKRQKFSGNSNDDSNNNNNSSNEDLLMNDVESSKTHVIMKESVEEEAMKLVQLWSSSVISNDHKNLDIPPEIMAAWISRDGNDIPHPPHPPLFAPSPPKLSDPTAKDMIGIDLAIKIVQRLLSPSGGIVLEICRALWMIHGLFEQSQYDTFYNFDTKIQNEHERLESELEARLSVAGTGMSEAVTLMNERERTIFHHQANQKRQQLVNQSAWVFRQLLYLQQVVLCKLDIPGFEDGPTVDAESLLLQSYICQYIHSAFYIRNRMGSEPHESMLRSQLKKLLREQEQQQQNGHSPKMNSVTTGSASPMLLPTTQHQQQYTATPMIQQMQNRPYNAYQQQQVYPQQQLQTQPMMTMVMANGMPQQQQQQYPQNPAMMYSQPMMMQQQSQFMLPQQQQQPMSSYLPMTQQQQQQYGQAQLPLPPPPHYNGLQPPPMQYPPYYQQ